MGPFEFRHAPVDGHGPRDELNPPKRPPYQRVWFRLAEKVGDAPELHRALLAYASAFQLLGTATLPQGISSHQPNVHMASLDHAPWVHPQFRHHHPPLSPYDRPNAPGPPGLHTRPLDH